MFGFTEKEVKVFKQLNTPKKIQDFLNKIPTNFEPDGDTVLSPRRVLRENRAHCMEGAMFAAAALRFHGYKPLVLDLTSVKDDDDHVITVFKHKGFWGAISKTNHAVLRYREPIYKNIRELVLSYFHEYFTNHDGKKTLRSYSMPVDLSRFDKQGWMTSEEDVWYVPEYLFEVPHKPILSRSQIAFLRKADQIEIEAGSITEWKKKDLCK
ncbi:hypothetical protein HYV87_01860 [Candidatus Woesearchaeota archaeon]|nr:hypothetical protein [Candidatus Woesearchaeota archaeon]MBI2581857.1 hypothetical protein [Candidatus Woesearchaeota archaeon]